MLRLVHPPPGGNGSDPSPRRKGSRSSALSLTDDEVRHLRAALRAAARAYGGLAVLAAVLGTTSNYLAKVHGKRPSGTLAVRLAKAVGITVEAVLEGKMGEVGRCPTCGRRVGA